LSEKKLEKIKKTTREFEPMPLDKTYTCPFCKEPGRWMKIGDGELPAPSCECLKREWERKEKRNIIQAQEYPKEMVDRILSEKYDREKLFPEVVEYDIENIEKGIGLILKGQTEIGKTFNLIWLACRIIYETRYIPYFVEFSTIQLEYDSNRFGFLNYINHLKKMNILILDNLAKKINPGICKAVGNGLIELINYKYQQQTPIFITTQEKPKEIEKLVDVASLDRVYSRSIVLQFEDKKNLREKVE